MNRSPCRKGSLLSTEWEGFNEQLKIGSHRVSMSDPDLIHKARGSRLEALQASFASIGQEWKKTISNSMDHDMCLCLF